MTIKEWWKNQKEQWQQRRKRISKYKGLSRAIRKGDVELLKTMLAEGAEPGLYGKNNYIGSPIEVCARRGTAEMMQLLVKHGGRADGYIIDAYASTGAGPGGGHVTTLYYAIQHGNDDVGAYLAKRPSVNVERSGFVYIGDRFKRDYPSPLETIDKEKMPQTYAVLARRRAGQLLEDADRIQRGPNMPRKVRDLSPW